MEQLQIDWLTSGQFVGSDEELARRLQEEELHALSPSTRTRRRARKAPDFFQPPDQAGGYGGYQCVAFAQQQKGTGGQSEPLTGRQRAKGSADELKENNHKQPQQHVERKDADKHKENVRHADRPDHRGERAHDARRAGEPVLGKRGAQPSSVAADHDDARAAASRSSKRQRPPAPDPLPLPPTRRQRSGDSRARSGSSQAVVKDPAASACTQSRPVEQARDTAHTAEPRAAHEVKCEADAGAGTGDDAKPSTSANVKQEDAPPTPRKLKVLKTHRRDSRSAKAGPRSEVPPAKQEPDDPAPQPNSLDALAAVAEDDNAHLHLTRRRSRHAPKAVPTTAAAVPGPAATTTGCSPASSGREAAAQGRGAQQQHNQLEALQHAATLAAVAEDGGRVEPAAERTHKPRKIPKLPMVLHGDCWYRARLVQDDGRQVLLEFPGFVGEGAVVWLARDSDRIWKGSYKGKDWKYLGDGAWAPKVKSSSRRGARPGSHAPHKAHRKSVRASGSAGQSDGEDNSSHEHSGSSQHQRRFDEEGEEDSLDAHQRQQNGRSGHAKVSPCSSSGPTGCRCSGSDHTHVHSRGTMDKAGGGAEQQGGSGSGSKEESPADTQTDGGLRGWKGAWKRAKKLEDQSSSGAGQSWEAGGPADGKQGSGSLDTPPGSGSGGPSAGPGAPNGSGNGSQERSGPVPVAPSPRRRKAINKPHRAPAEGQYLPPEPVQAVVEQLQQPTRQGLRHQAALHRQHSGRDQQQQPGVPRSGLGQPPPTWDSRTPSQLLRESEQLSAEEKLDVDAVAAAEPQGPCEHGEGLKLEGEKTDVDAGKASAQLLAAEALAHAAAEAGATTPAGAAEAEAAPDNVSPHASGGEEQDPAAAAADAAAVQPGEPRCSLSSPVLSDSARPIRKRRVARGVVSDILRPGRGRGRGARAWAAQGGAGGCGGFPPLAPRAGSLTKPALAASAGSGSGRALHSSGSLQAFATLLRALGALEATPPLHLAAQQAQGQANAAGLQWLAQEQLARILSIHPGLFSSCSSEHRSEATVARPPLPLFQ